MRDDETPIITLSDGQGDLDGILRLQTANLERSLPPDEALAEGYVTLVHTHEKLAAMHALCPSVVARAGAEVVAYALVMPPECRALEPVLDPMFSHLDRLLPGARFYVMGQICIAKPFRGPRFGLFDALYAAHREHFHARWDLCATEVALRNTRSLRAHERVGFERLLVHTDATDTWALMTLDLRAPAPPR